MRKLNYLSPTSLQIWEQNKETFYLYYLADNKIPREPQTKPMSVGSAFDAYIKNYLYEILFGNNISTMDIRFRFENIFENQVEEQNRDYALEAGKKCFDAYIKSGAAADLIIELKMANDVPQFEFSVQRWIESVSILGKPDLYFVNAKGKPIILDWKVNGYDSKWKTYPKRGYVKIRGTDKGQHKDAFVMDIGGVKVNVAERLEIIDKTWATQLATYAWLCGAMIGSDFIVTIDQLCCNGDDIKVAEHRLMIGKEFQKNTLIRYQELWSIVESDWIFRDKSKEESMEICKMLDRRYEIYGNKDINMELLR